MSRDRTAQAAQLARLFESEGEPLTFGAVPFYATIQPYEPEGSPLDRNKGNDTTVLVETARSFFGSVLPRQGQSFSGAGKLYAIAKVPSIPPTEPLVQFICTVTALT